MKTKNKPKKKSGHTIYKVEPTIGRNVLCPCGSGKKFKHCCIRRAQVRG